MFDEKQRNRGIVGLASVAGLLAGAQLLSVVAAADSGTGTLVGSVECGSGRAASDVLVQVEGTQLSAHPGAHGAFSLAVPAGQSFTVVALTDPQGAPAASRFDVVVQPGETLDIGSLSVASCPSVHSDEANVAIPQGAWDLL
jgi:hypothetical protein